LATCRLLRVSTSFCRNISRTCRMGSRSVAISPPGSEDGRLEERPSVAAHPSPLGRRHVRRDHAPAKGVVTPAKRVVTMAKRVVTMPRNRWSRCRETGGHDRAKSARDTRRLHLVVRTAESGQHESEAHAGVVAESDVFRTALELAEWATSGRGRLWSSPG
jgi:hypothetical protein